MKENFYLDDSKFIIEEEFIFELVVDIIKFSVDVFINEVIVFCDIIEIKEEEIFLIVKEDIEKVVIEKLLEEVLKESCIIDVEEVVFESDIEIVLESVKEYINIEIEKLSQEMSVFEVVVLYDILLKVIDE